MNVTAIVPTADRPHLLSHALQSIYNQIQVAARIIVVDNGRMPVDAHTLRGDETLIRSAPRIGAAAARNLGLAAATTDLVAFLDDDDWWPENFLEASVGVIIESGADMTVAPLWRVTDDGRVDVTWKVFTQANRRRVFWSNPGFTGSNVVYRRGCLLAVGGFAELKNLPQSEDRDLLARFIIARSRIVGTGSATHVNYRDHGSADRLSGALVRSRLTFFLRHYAVMSWTARMRSVLSIVRPLIWRRKA